MNNTLFSEFEQCNEKSDKTLHHGYQRFYPYFLEPLRQIQNMKMLELGYDDGYSIGIWQKYFDNPRIDSIDIINDPKDERLANFFQVNQDKNTELDLFVQNNKENYKFIIDDASHIPSHQWNTFLRFFDILEEGGVYIIEDTETNFWGRAWQYGYGFDSRIFSIYQKIEIINEFISAEFIEENLQQKHHLTDLEVKCYEQIELMTLGQNCMIFVKKSDKFKEYYRDFKDYKQKHKVNLVDISQKPLHQRIIRKFKKILSK
jgi:hypothetical protein